MLSDPRDLVRMRDGIRRVRALALTAPVAAIADRVEYGLSGRSIEDALDGRGARRLDDGRMRRRPACERHLPHGRGRRSAHPSSIPHCRVIGCTGLRVMDASIMPEIVRANTHLTTVMIAEKMAATLRELPAEP